MTRAKAPEYNAQTIRDASTNEIKEFAQKEAGLVFPEGTSRDYMCEQIGEALGWLRINPADDATHVVLRIAVSPEEGGHLPVRLGYQGRMMTVQREQDVEVPIGFYHVLMDINSLGFEIPPLKKGALKDQSPLQNKVQVTKFPVSILRFVNKGKA